MQQPDPSQMRVSDADRHQVAEVLREAAAEGRLDLDELDERLEATYAAKVYADLVPITFDLPASGTPVPLGTPHALAPQGSVPGALGIAPTWFSSTAILSGVVRKGVWDVPVTHTAFAMMGSVELDLREARFAGPEVVITANAVMGEVNIYVNAHTHVIVGGSGVMGDFSQSRDKVPAEYVPGSPVVRVKGVALMGAVTVTRKRMPGEPRPRRKLLGR